MVPKLNCFKAMQVLGGPQIYCIDIGAEKLSQELKFFWGGAMNHNDAMLYLAKNIFAN